MARVGKCVLVSWSVFSDKSPLLGLPRSEFGTERKMGGAGMLASLLSSWLFLKVGPLHA